MRRLQSAIYHGAPTRLFSMEHHSRLLLDVWREACRHIEIAEATDLITPLIVRHLPVDQLALRVIDLERGTVDTVAASACDHSRPSADCAANARPMRSTDCCSGACAAKSCTRK